MKGWLLTAFLGCLLSCAVKAREPARDLISVIEDPWWIFAGTVVVEPTDVILHDYFGDLSKVVVRVDKKLKGHPSTAWGEVGRIEFLVRTSSPEVPKYSVGESYVLFMNVGDAGPVLLPSHFGARKIDANSCVDLSLMRDVPSRISLNTFARIVREVVAGRVRSGKDIAIMDVVVHDTCASDLQDVDSVKPASATN